MKTLRTHCLLLLILFLTGCYTGRAPVSSPTQQPSFSVSRTPSPTQTVQPTNTVVPTQTVVPTPDPCSKETLPVETMGPEQPDLYTNKLIAFTLENEEESRDVYVADWDGQNQRNLTNWPADDSGPLWSPDGSQLAFLSNRNSAIAVPCNGASDECMYELFVIKPNGSGLKRVTKGWTFYPSWSPDGKQIAFVGAFKSRLAPTPEDPFLYDIFVVNADGSNLRNLTQAPGYYSDPVWSPDGQRIAFQSGELTAYPNSINIMNADGTGLAAYSERQASEMVWSADGRSLFFASAQGNVIDRLNADSFALEQLTASPKEVKNHLSLSPDGRWLAYHLQSYDFLCDQIRVLDTGTLRDYFVYDAREIEQIPLNESGITATYSSFGISSLLWRPDSRALIFEQWLEVPPIFGQFTDTFAVALDGSHPEHINPVQAIQP